MPKAPSILKLCKDPAKATVGKFYEFKNATDTRERLRKEVLSLGFCNQPE